MLRILNLHIWSQLSPIGRHSLSTDFVLVFCSFDKICLGLERYFVFEKKKWWPFAQLGRVFTGPFFTKKIFQRWTKMQSTSSDCLVIQNRLKTPPSENESDTDSDSGAFSVSRHPKKSNIEEAQRLSTPEMIRHAFNVAVIKVSVMSYLSVI